VVIDESSGSALALASCLLIVKKLGVVKLLPSGRPFPRISCTLQFAGGWMENESCAAVDFTWRCRLHIPQ
jgi:hypothetical protein